MIIWTSIIVIYIVSIIFSSYSTVYTLINHEKYGSKINVVILLIGLINTGIIFTTLFVLSTLIYISDAVNLILWKACVISGILQLVLVSLEFSFIYRYKKIPLIPFLFFIVLIGLILGAFFSLDAILIDVSSTLTLEEPLNLNMDGINYQFSSFIAGSVSILLLGSLIFIHHLSIQIYTEARKKDLSYGFIFNVFFFSIPMLFYILYIYLQLPIFRELFFFLLVINFMLVCIVLIKKPDAFLALTNKIYYINVYHKSGILLFSYKFESGNESEYAEPAIWGNILIGINHILSEFINKADQIDMLQTKHNQILVNYNNDYGFAVLVITNHKNEIVNNLTNNFIKDFTTKYKVELSEILDLNRIIDVAEFEDTKNIIEKNFKMYLN